MKPILGDIFMYVHPFKGQLGVPVTVYLPMVIIVFSRDSWGL